LRQSTLFSSIPKYDQPRGFADDFGFESSTFGGSSFSNPSDQPHTEKTAQKQTPSQSQGPPQVQSVFAGNPSHQEQPKTAPQPPSDWDLFFTER